MTSKLHEFRPRVLGETYLRVPSLGPRERGRSMEANRGYPNQPGRTDKAKFQQKGGE